MYVGYANLYKLQIIDIALHISLPELFVQEEELLRLYVGDFSVCPRNQISKISDLMMGYARNSCLHVSRILNTFLFYEVTVCLHLFFINNDPE